MEKKIKGSEESRSEYNVTGKGLSKAYVHAFYVLSLLSLKHRPVH